MKRILYLYNVETTWTQNDMKHLASKHSLTPLLIKTKPNAFKAANPLLILKHDIVFCWFGSLNFLPCVLMAKLLGRKITIIAGGFDVARVPTIKYGGFYRSTLSMFLRRLIFALADKVSTVSKYNTMEANTNAGVRFSKIRMIYHGFQETEKSVKAFSERKNQIISVGSINPETLKRKGHDRFVKLAQELPEYQFVLAGRYAQECKDKIEKLNIPNLKLVGFLDDSALSRLMEESKIYVQLSEHEAFGCSVVEAGLHGCKIIASNKSALPEIVGRSGSIFDPDDISGIKNLLKEQMAETDFNTERQVKSFQTRFPVSSRKAGLLEMI